MGFTTIRAKYPGKCRRCGGWIEPGDRMRFGGIGRTYHMASDCPAVLDRTEGAFERGAEPQAEAPADRPVAVDGGSVLQAILAEGARREANASAFRQVAQPATDALDGFTVEHATTGASLSRPRTPQLPPPRYQRPAPRARVSSLISGAFTPAPAAPAHVQVPDAPELPSFTDTELARAAEGRPIEGDVMRELLAGFVAKGGER